MTRHRDQRGRYARRSSPVRWNLRLGPFQIIENLSANTVGCLVLIVFLICCCGLCGAFFSSPS